MSECEKYYEQIFHFDTLTAEEKKQIISHSRSCERCREQLREIVLLTRELKQTPARGHLDEGNLVRFGIYLANPKSPSYDGGKFTRKEIRGIRTHLSACVACRKKVEEVTQQYFEIDQYLEHEGVPDVPIPRYVFWLRLKDQLARGAAGLGQMLNRLIPSPGNRLVPVAVTTFALLVLVWFGPMFRGSRDQLFKLATIEKKSLSYVTRGAGSQLLLEGFQAFDKGEYEKACTLLDSYLANPRDASSSDFVHEIAGVSYLLQSRSDILGRFQRVDRNDLNRGIHHLRQALEMTRNQHIQEDAYWYLGKAYLLGNDQEKARSAFEQVIQLKGKRTAAAQEILRQIDRLETE